MSGGKKKQHGKVAQLIFKAVLSKEFRLAVDRFRKALPRPPKANLTDKGIINWTKKENRNNKLYKKYYSGLVNILLKFGLPPSPDMISGIERYIRGKNLLELSNGSDSPFIFIEKRAGNVSKKFPAINLVIMNGASGDEIVRFVNKNLSEIKTAINGGKGNQRFRIRTNLERDLLIYWLMQKSKNELIKLVGEKDRTRRSKESLVKEFLDERGVNLEFENIRKIASKMANM